MADKTLQTKALGVADPLALIPSKSKFVCLKVSPAGHAGSTGQTAAVGIAVEATQKGKPGRA